MTPQPQPLSTTEAMGPPELYGPPVPVPVKPVVLVFGPGKVRSFASVGVLKALHEAKIPIGEIRGAGTGALIGALYAINPNLNHLEWAILKLKEEYFNQPKAMNRYLKQMFGDREFKSSNIPLRLMVPIPQKGRSSWLDSGQIASALSLVLTAPSQGLFNPATLVSELGQGPMITVNLVAPQANFQINPDFSGMSDSDFGKKTEAAFRGKNAIMQVIEEIRRQVGGATPHE